MKRFWVGLKNKKVLIVIFLVFFSFFSNNFANAIDLTNPNSNFVTPDEVKKKAEQEKKNREIEEKRKKDNQVVPTTPTGRSSQPTTDKTQQDVRNNTANNDRIKCEEAYKKAKAAGVDEKKLNELKKKCNYSPATNDGDWTKKNNEAKAAIEEIDKQTNEANANKDKNSCAIEWIGWIVCPIVRGSTGVVVGLYNFMQANFLNIKSDQLFSNSGKGQEAFKHWVAFRDIANIFFVIMIAIIIFSQVTGVGISNYGIKKMLPKIIIYAILVNISWYIVVIAIDISNIVGSTLFKWLSNDGNWSFSSDVQKETSPVEGILTGTAATGALIAAGVTAALVGGATILLFIASAALAVVMTVFILMIREAAVIVLVVTSPLAFVAGLLPNTEGIFKKWIKLTKNMLMIYPICSLIVGGALFVSNLLYGVVDDPLLKIIYGVLPILSLFAIIAVIKTVLSFIDGLTGGNLRGAIDRVSGKINSVGQNSNWAKASREKAANRSIAGIPIGKNARTAKYEEGQYRRNRNELRKLQAKRNPTASDYRRMGQLGAAIGGFEKGQTDGMVTAMASGIGNSVSNVNSELARISNVSDPVQQGLMYSALSQAVTKSGLNSAGQAAAMSSIANSALNIGDAEQRKSVAAQIASKAGSDIKKVNPAAAKAVMQDFSSENIKSVQDFENDISTYSGASAKQMADWSDMSSANVNDNKAFKAMQSAFNSGDQSKISQAQNMGKIAEQALTANANGTMSLTPDQQANFMAMQKLAQSHAPQTATVEAAASNNNSMNNQSSPSQKVEVTAGQNWQTSAPQQAQAGSSDASASSSVTYGAPAAQVDQASQPINNGNQNIQPRQTASDPTKSNRKFGAN
ncbi:MAG: hypothetical protein ACFN24_00480 [Candidatus Nanogingivalis sp.]